MSTVELKTQIHDYVEQLQDDNFIEKVYTMLDTYVKKQHDTIVGYDKSPEKIKAKLKPNGIATIDLQYGVSLEEIKKRQTINKITFEKLQKMSEGEEWEQTLDELIESID